MNAIKLTSRQVNVLIESLFPVLTEQPSFDRYSYLQNLRPGTSSQGALARDASFRAAPPVITTKDMEFRRINDIARELYDCKKSTFSSVFGGATDDEERATKLITSIKNLQEFEAVQKNLKKRTDGRGIATYIASFFGTYDSTYNAALKAALAMQSTGPSTWAAQLGLEKYTNRNHRYVVKRLDIIIKHLESIKAWPSSIKILKDTRNKIQRIATAEDLIWKRSKTLKPLTAFWDEYHHEILLVAQIAAALFLPYGMFIAAGIGFYDAHLYWQEKDYYASGIAGFFAAMPGIFKAGGYLASKLPALAGAIERLGAAGMRKLGEKVAQLGGPAWSRAFSKGEELVLRLFSGGKNAIKQLFLQEAKTRATAAATKAMLRTSRMLAKSGAVQVVAGKGPAARDILYGMSKMDRVMLAVSCGVIDLAKFAGQWAIYDKAANAATDAFWEPFYDKHIGEKKEAKDKMLKQIDDMYYDQFGMHTLTYPILNVPSKDSTSSSKNKKSNTGWENF